MRDNTQQAIGKDTSKDQSPNKPKTRSPKVKKEDGKRAPREQASLLVKFNKGHRRPAEHLDKAPHGARGGELPQTPKLPNNLTCKSSAFWLFPRSAGRWHSPLGPVGELSGPCYFVGFKLQAPLWSLCKVNHKRWRACIPEKLQRFLRHERICGYS